jgi:hypothetical protein
MPLSIDVPDDWEDDKLDDAIDAEIQGAIDNRDIELDDYEETSIE